MVWFVHGWIRMYIYTHHPLNPHPIHHTHTGYRSGLGGKLVTGAKIVTAPVWKHLVKQGARTAGGSAHEKDMEAFYKFQKDGASGLRFCVDGVDVV